MKMMREDRLDNDKGDDATWILTSAFIIFTMQSGFGLLEAGSVTAKNEANIMVKNAIDVIFGGLSYWICGYAFSFGNKDYKGAITAFIGVGDFLTGTIDHRNNYGDLYSKYFFQLSFATTATTIVSGAMAERTNLKAYIFFSFVHTVSYVFPAHWIWDERGFLYQLGVTDIAGCGPVHVFGGMSALVGTMMLKPRTGVFDEGVDSSTKQPMCSPTNMLLGTFMLWWGWLGFNCGSTYGISGIKWKLASRTAVLTINGSIGGGVWGVLYSYKFTKIYNGKLDIANFVGCILGGLVSITAISSTCQPWLALFIGFIGGALSSYGKRFLIYVEVDDPVTAIPVHLFCGIWGMIAVGLFCDDKIEHGLSRYAGIVYGGHVKFIGIQLLACAVIMVWSATTTFIQLKLIDAFVGLRLSYEEEMIGADEAAHGIKRKDEITAGIYPYKTHCACCLPKSPFSATSASKMFIGSPTVIVNKTYARQIYNGQKGIINVGYTSRTSRRATVHDPYE